MTQEIEHSAADRRSIQPLAPSPTGGQPASAFPSLQTGKRPNCGVAGVIRDEESQILMIKRTGSHGAGTWAVPGGWVEHMEGPLAALRREMWEEVGVTVQNAVFAAFTHDVHPEGLEDICLWFNVISWQGTVRNGNTARITDIAWFPRGQLPTPLFAAVQNAIEGHIL